jgi:hypothetical protein
MNRYLITVAVLLLTATAAATGVYYSNKLIEPDVFNNKNLVDVGTQNPPIWLYYDQSEVNSRWWQDFGARSSRVLHLPYLNLCYQSIAVNCGKTYNIRVIAGLSDLATLLGGWNELPKSLQNPLASVQEAEMNYIRAKVLKTYGGLWVNPSSVFVRELDDLSELKKVVFVGNNTTETYSDGHGTLTPGTNMMYAPRKEHEIFVDLERLARERLERREGGSQFRNDISNDLRDVMERYNKEFIYLPEIEFSRQFNGRRVELEELLSKGSMMIPKEVVFVSIPYEELKRRRNFGWFLRMSEEQIQTSDLVISSFFN